MTKIFYKSSEKDPTYIPEKVTLMVNPETKQILKYYQTKDKDSRFKAPLVNFNGKSRVAVRTDLIDCGIDICAKEIMRHVKEDSTVTSLKNNFCNNIIDSEICSDMIFMHEIENQYFARVQNPKQYARIFKDVLNRYTYPLTVESIHMRHSSVSSGEV